MIFSKLLLPFLKKEKKKERNGIVIESAKVSSATLFPSRFRTLRLEIRLGKRFHEWANRRRSFSPVQSRRVSPGVRATRQSREPGSARRRRAKKKPCGGGEGEDKWPGRGSPLKRSSGVSSVEARVAQGAQRPLPSPPTPAPLVLVSSWKSIAGKRVKIHPCPRKNLTQGWTGSAGGGLKSEKEGKGWRGKEREEEGGREREREWKRLRWRDLGETRFTYLGVVLPTLSGSPLLAETCLVCAILAFTALKHRRSLAGKNSTGMELPRIGTSWMGWNFGGFNLGAIYIFSLSTAIFARE